MAGSVALPVPISQVAGRYFLYDTDVITFLRREHHITGVLIGTLPQAPQQNVFLGVPIELMPEEARLLVEKSLAYVIDDAPRHRDGLRDLRAAERTAILAVFRKQGSEAAQAAQNQAGKRKAEALKRKGMNPRQEKSSDSISNPFSDQSVDEDELLFASPANSFPTPSPHSSTPLSSTSVPEIKPFGITPPLSYPLLAPPQPPSEPSSPSLVEVPPSYPLFRHLHDKGYFLSPGLRFGAQYMAYPGDPLRFHSHFLAVGKDWEDEWELGELVAGGRLGTGVKKGFLIGGEVAEEGNGHCRADDGGGTREVRTFCVEWSGM